MSKKIISLVIIIVAIILSFIISLRDTIFNGQPIDEKNLTGLIIFYVIAGSGIFVLSLVTTAKKKK